MQIQINEVTVSSSSIEEVLRVKKRYLIGCAILKMNFWQRIWWCVTGQSKYMKWEYWENAND